MKRLVFTKDLAKLIAECIIGNIFIGIGVAITKMATLGIDPFNGMCISVSSYFHISYPVFTWSYNTALFIAEIIWGRKYINIGTFINWFLLCYVVAFCIPIFEKFFCTNFSDVVSLSDGNLAWKSSAAIYALRLAILIGGLIVISFGLALYQIANLGVAPYDALPLMIIDRFPKIKFFFARICFDGTSALIIWLCGGIVGVGTLATAFGLGPIVHLFMMLLRGKKHNS